MTKARFVGFACKLMIATTENLPWPRRRSRGARDEEPAIVLSVGASGRLVAVVAVVGAIMTGAQPSRQALMAGFHAKQRRRTAIASTTEP
jgi:hypothetical protein